MVMRDTPYLRICFLCLKIKRRSHTPQELMVNPLKWMGNGSRLSWALMNGQASGELYLWSQERPSMERSLFVLFASRGIGNDDFSILWLLFLVAIYYKIYRRYIAPGTQFPYIDLVKASDCPVSLVGRWIKRPLRKTCDHHDSYNRRPHSHPGRPS